MATHKPKYMHTKTNWMFYQSIVLESNFISLEPGLKSCLTADNTLRESLRLHFKNVMLCGDSVHWLLCLQGHGCKMVWEASLVCYEIVKNIIHNPCLLSLSTTMITTQWSIFLFLSLSTIVIIIIKHVIHTTK